MTCDRYETEGLTGFPQTPALREHLASCADCQATQSSYARLERLVGVKSQAVPPPGWEQRLSNRLAQQAQPRRLPLRTLAAAAAALAASVFLVLPSRRATEPMLAVETKLISSTQARAASASVGSTWKVKVDARQEVRIWRNQSTLVLQCPAGNACELDGPRQVAKVPLTAPGEYRAMVLTRGAAPLPAPVSFDEDARLARQAGAVYEVVEPINVF